MLVWIFLCTSFGDHMYSCLLGIHIGIESLVHRVGICSALALVNTDRKFSKVVVWIHNFYVHCVQVWIAPHSCQYLVFSFLVFLFYIVQVFLNLILNSFIGFLLCNCSFHFQVIFHVLLYFFLVFFLFSTFKIFSDFSEDFNTRYFLLPSFKFPVPLSFFSSSTNFANCVSWLFLFHPVHHPQMFGLSLLSDYT